MKRFTVLTVLAALICMGGTALADPVTVQADADAYVRFNQPTSNFGTQCLLARRMAEAGVRYIYVDSGNVWDQHSDLVGGHTRNAR